MKSILVDTSGKLLSITICNDGEFIAGISKNIGPKMNESLLPILLDLFDSYGLTFEDIDSYNIIVGPGSFTGIRIGVATLLGITTGINKKLQGISSLDAAALSLGQDIISIAVRLRGREFVLKNYNFKDNLFSNFKFVNQEEIDKNTIILYENDLDLSKALLNEKYNNFIRDYLPFYMRKSEAEINFDKKSQVN